MNCYSDGTTANSYRYTAREYDAETGLYYYRARYYDPSIGRFMNEDPLQHAGGANMYAYVLNNPERMIDPWGLMNWNYDVSYQNHGWGLLLDGETKLPSLPLVKVRCDCLGDGKWQMSIKVTFRLVILYGTNGQLDHENGHLRILQDHFKDRTRYYSEKYERVFGSYSECVDAMKHMAIMTDIRSDLREVNEPQHEHEDWVQNAIQWVFDHVH